MGDVELKGVRGREHRQFSQTGFMELGKAGVDRIEMAWRIGVLRLKVLPVEAAGKGGNMNNQAGFWGE